MKLVMIQFFDLLFIHLKFKREAVCSSKTLVSTYKFIRRGVTTQKTNIDIFSAVRTSNLGDITQFYKLLETG
jgi:hypothetical protein